MASPDRARGPVNRPIEGYLSRVMGQRAPAGLIRPRPTEPIKACGLAPRHQAGHMTAIGLRCRHVKKSLRAGGHPHRTRGPSAHGRDPWASRPSGARNKDVDARIKSAQDDFKWFLTSPKQVILPEVISPDSPAPRRE